MSKIGKVRSSLEQDDEGKLNLTGEEAQDLAKLLEEANEAAGEITTEKADGIVVLSIDGGKATVSTGKVKKESEDDDEK